MLQSLRKFLFGAPDTGDRQVHESLPQLAYKYTSAQWLESIVTEGLFAFPGIDRLNDPHESAFDATAEQLLSENSIPQHTGDLRERDLIQVRIGSMRDFLENPYAEKYRRERIERDMAALRKRNEEIDQINRQRGETRTALARARTEIGVLALTRRRCHVLMWAHYGQNSSGLCVGLDISDPGIAAYAPSASGWDDSSDLFRPQSIVYGSEVPHYWHAATRDIVRAAFFTKSREWSYEAEVRILRPVRDKDAVSTGPVALFRFPKRAITEVLLGPAALPETVKLATQLATRSDAPRFFRVEVSSTSYALHVRPL